MSTKVFNVCVSAISDWDHIAGLNAKSRAPVVPETTQAKTSILPAGFCLLTQSIPLRQISHAITAQLILPKNADIKFTPHAGFGRP